ncbi:MAG: DUF167 domain-containing protein [candidate division WOR-3 bacterium]
MQIQVLVKPRSNVNKVIPNPDGSFTVTVAAPPVEGKANQAVVAALAEFFKVPKTFIRLVAGERSRRKIFQITERG